MRLISGARKSHAFQILNPQKDIFIYMETRLIWAGLVQQSDKIVVRSSHDLSLFVAAVMKICVSRHQNFILPFRLYRAYRPTNSHIQQEHYYQMYLVNITIHILRVNIFFQLKIRLRPTLYVVSETELGRIVNFCIHFLIFIIKSKSCFN